MNKEIKNIVFYTFESETGPRTQTCIFYMDGSVKNTNEEEGRELQEALKKGEITPRDPSKVHVYKMTGKILERDFDLLKGRGEDIEFADVPSKKTKKAKKSFTETLKTITGINLIKKLNDKRKAKKAAKEAAKLDDEVEVEDEIEEEKSKKSFIEVLKTITGVNLANKIKAKYKAKKKNYEEKKASKPKKEEGKFKKFFKKTFIGKIARQVAALATAAALLFVPGCSSKTQSNADKEPTAINDTVEMGTDDLLKETLSFAGMLKLSKSETQKDFMFNISQSLSTYNITFAKAYVEQGKDIKAALTWDEAVAMAIVYNNYSKEELIETFNGADLDVEALKDAYKTANLQLMGAHVIETEANPVDMSQLLGSKEAKAFYKKYHDMFLACKKATGTDQINKVNAFYQELYKDFPITEKVREEGIAHSDSRKSVESYKFSVIPMVSASEMLFQNLKTDKTLQDKAIAYLNDVGVCNRANDLIERAATINLMTKSEDDCIDYELLKNAKISELKEAKAYGISDEERDLSKLDSFKKALNANSKFTAKTATKTTTETVTEYRTETTRETTSDRDQAVKAAGADKVDAAEREADKAVEKENEAARKDAEKKADEEAKRQQEKSDAEKKDLENDIAQKDKDLQDKIDKANEDINNDQSVSEKDFGDHDVDFDNDHSDKDGKLKDSVKDITTDPSGDMTNQPLPDPNADDEYVSTPSKKATDQTIYEYEEPYTMTNEEKAAAIVEQMANETTYGVDRAKTYTYHK